MCEDLTLPQSRARGTFLFHRCKTLSNFSIFQFIGNILNWMFMGTLVMQLYTYYQNFPSDRIIIRILVYGLFLVDVAQTVILTFHGWFFAVSAWGNPATFDIIPWSGPMIPVLCGLVAATVQIFYAW
ncbi:hypothetical protein B0H13DRAFT_1623267 [Mycena leptocephala]|nr:hypothetical protein B0H13DRAFT_1623267 [Mycena leptocephala]